MSPAVTFAEAARAVREAVPVEFLAERLGIPLARGRGPCLICGTSRNSQAFSVRGQRWRCFACGAHGDAIDLVRAVRGCSPREALAELARETGIDLRKPVSPQLRRRIALDDVRRDVARLRSRRLTRLAIEAGRWERLADLDAEAAAVAWRLGRAELARTLAVEARQQRERAEQLDREAERIADDEGQPIEGRFVALGALQDCNAAHDLMLAIEGTR